MLQHIAVLNPKDPSASLHLICKIMVESGGGEFIGLQGTCPEMSLDTTLVLFNDPVTQSTAALPLIDGFSTDAVARRLAEKRAAFNV